MGTGGGATVSNAIAGQHLPVQSMYNILKFKCSCCNSNT